VVGQHADSVRQRLVGREVHTFIACRSAIQGLRDIREVLSVERVLPIQHAPLVFVRGGRTNGVVLRRHRAVRLDHIQRARSQTQELRGIACGLSIQVNCVVADIVRRQEPGNPAQFLGLGPCSLNVVQPNGTVAPQNNTVCSTTANENQRRVLYRQDPLNGQYFANIAQALNGGTASYEGMYFSANKALSHGISMLANYTMSHCISDVYDQQPSGNGLTRPDDRRAYRGNCTVGVADVRHFFTLNMVANVPKFSNKAL